MKMQPFYWIDPFLRNRVFCASFVIAIFAMTFLQWVDTYLQTRAAPYGIVSFEIAGSLERANDILNSWDSDAKAWANINLWFDFLFIAAYTMTIGLGCAIVADRFGPERRRLQACGVILAWSMLLAAILDCVENYSLINLLHGSQNGSFAVIADGCASAKFLIIGICIFYVLGGWIMSRNDRPI